MSSLPDHSSLGGVSEGNRDIGSFDGGLAAATGRITRLDAAVGDGRR